MTEFSPKSLATNDPEFKPNTKELSNSLKENLEAGIARYKTMTDKNVSNLAQMTSLATLRNADDPNVNKTESANNELFKEAA